MKNLLAAIVLLFAFTQLNAQDLKDQRVVYSYVNTFIDYDMIEKMDPGSLTPKETQKYTEWKKRLTARILDRTLENTNAYFSEKGAEVQPLETASKFGMMAMSAHGYPAIGFPKKTLKKKGEKLDLGDYFISLHVDFDKGGAKPSLKGYTPAFTVEIKVFSKVGEKLQSFKAKGLTEKKIGVVSMKVKPDYFSRTDFESIDYLMDNFGAGLDDAVAEVLGQLK